MSDSAPDPRADFERLRALFGAVSAFLAVDAARLSRAVPEISGWSPAQHIAHLTLANELCARNVASLSRKSGMLVRSGRPMDAGAVELLASGSLPRGRAQSPRIVRPPEELDLAMVRSWHADNARALEELAPELARLAAGDPTIAHQSLGPLDGPHWLRFMLVHTRHHLSIAREVLTATGPLELAALPEL